ncbi:hypothetical protein CRYUN_Cryun09bG0003600 [Craigia yunnanensis]
MCLCRTPFTSLTLQAKPFIPLQEYRTIFDGFEDILSGIRRKSSKKFVSPCPLIVIGSVELTAVGVSVSIFNLDSPMHGPAEQFLTWRAFGAPPIVIALAAQGTFRGFKDTKTPLYAIGKLVIVLMHIVVLTIVNYFLELTGAVSLLNAILDTILIFSIGFGVGGAALATVTSEYLIAIILLWELNGKVVLISPNVDWRKVALYIKSGGLLIGSTIATLGTLTLATSLAARQGPIPMAVHQICIQVWLAVSLLTDALVLSAQIFKKIGLVAGFALDLAHFLACLAQIQKFSKLPSRFVTGSQPVNDIAFVLHGLYYGVSDFEYAAVYGSLTSFLSNI